jgi:pyruvate/2-oxoacid:ferredoxin oxidoreductase beta subunit
MLKSKHCVVCGGGVDPSVTSAHFVEVHWFCSAHGRAFHASTTFVAARRAARTDDCLRVIAGWLERAKQEFEASPRCLAA